MACLLYCTPWKLIFQVKIFYMPIVVAHQYFIYYPSLLLRYTFQPTAMNPSCHDIEFCWIENNLTSRPSPFGTFSIFSRFRNRKQSKRTVLLPSSIYSITVCFPFWIQSEWIFDNVCVAWMFYPFHSCSISTKEAGVRTARATKHKNHPYRNFPTDSVRVKPKQTKAFPPLSYTMRTLPPFRNAYLLSLSNAKFISKNCLLAYGTMKSNVFVEALIRAHLV